MSIQRLTEITEEVKTTRQKFNAAQARIAENPDFTEEYKQRETAKNTENLRAHLGTLQDEAQRLRTALETVTPAQNDTALAEIQEQRAWARISKQLEAGRSWNELLQEAVTAKDLTSVHALRTEGPGYLASLRSKTTGPDGEEGKALRFSAAQLQRETDIALGAIGTGPAKYQARDRVRLAALYPVLEAHLSEENTRPGAGTLRIGLVESAATNELANAEKAFAPAE